MDVIPDFFFSLTLSCTMFLFHVIFHCLMQKSLSIADSSSLILARGKAWFQFMSSSTLTGGYPLQYSWAFLVDQLVKNPPAMRETWLWSLVWEDPLEKGTAIHSSILAWRIPWTIQSLRSQRVNTTEPLLLWHTLLSNLFNYIN